MATLGESNVVELFSSKLERAVIHKFGASQKYLKGNFAGNADKIFADFFAGVPFSNVLIEFKNTSQDDRSEKRKPLRQKLCQSLTDGLHDLSVQCHFIGWGNTRDSPQLKIFLAAYVSTVCPKIGGASVPLQPQETMPDQQFFLQMFDGSIGLPITEFIAYLIFLANLPDDPSGLTTSQISFPAQLLSFNDEDGVVSTALYNLSDLEKASESLSRYEASMPSNDPTQSRGATRGMGGGGV